MRRFLRHILLFLAILLPVYVLLIWMLGGTGGVRTVVTDMGNTGHLFSRVRECRQYHDIDVLFIGSSHTYRTFDTRYYRAHGISCFNLGSSNQTPVQSLTLLTDYIDSLRPRCVVFEVHPDIIILDGVESCIDILCNTPLTPTTCRMALQTGNMKVANTCLYAFYSQRIRHRLDNFVEDSIINLSAYVPGGYVEINDSLFHYSDSPTTTIIPHSRQEKALRPCLSLLNQRCIPYLLVEVPDTRELRASYTNLDEFQRQMSDLGPFVCDTLPLVDTIHFYNPNHLNTKGTAIYNQWFLPILLKFMAEHGISPSIQNDTLCAY